MDLELGCAHRFRGVEEGRKWERRWGRPDSTCTPYLEAWMPPLPQEPFAWAVSSLIILAWGALQIGKEIRVERWFCLANQTRDSFAGSSSLLFGFLLISGFCDHMWNLLCQRLGRTTGRAHIKICFTRQAATKFLLRHIVIVVDPPHFDKVLPTFVSQLGRKECFFRVFTWRGGEGMGKGGWGVVVVVGE